MSRHVWIAAYGLLLTLTFLWRRGGLDPVLLWQDDVWVAFLIRHASLGEVFRLPVSLPTGIYLPFKLMRAAVGDPELSLQLFPFFCGLLQIPLLGLLVSRVTGRASLGFFAAVLLAANPLVGAYSVRVKQFMSDGVLTLLVLLAAAPAFRSRSSAALARLCLVSALSLPFSYTSVLISGPLVHLALLRQRRPWRLRAVGGPVLAYDLWCLLYYGLRMRHQSIPSVTDHWGKTYVSVESLDAFREGAHRLVETLVTQVFPPGLSWLVVLVPLGLWATRWRCQAAWLFAYGLFLILGVGVSALRVYPLGGGRPDLFHFPFTIFIASLGMGWIGDRLRGFRFGAWGTGAAALAVLLWVPVSQKPVIYRGWQVFSKNPLPQLDRLYREGAGVIAFDGSQWLMGYYLDWPLRIRWRSDNLPQLVFDKERVRFVHNPLPAIRALGADRDRLVYFQAPRNHKHGTRRRDLEGLLEKEGFFLEKVWHEDPWQICLVEYRKRPPVLLSRHGPGLNR